MKTFYINLGRIFAVLVHKLHRYYDATEWQTLPLHHGTIDSFSDLYAYN